MEVAATISLKGASVLVTGAAGFLGSHLCERLLDEGAAVIGVDNFDPFYDPGIKRSNLACFAKRISFIEADIRNQDAMAAVFAMPVDIVAHLAGYAGVRSSIERPSEYCDVNVTGTANMLQLATRINARHFVFASSSSVYGDRVDVPFRETNNVDRPISPYAATKRAGELLCATWNALYSLPTSCLRFFTAYGPRQRPDMAIARFARLIGAGRPVPMFGDGSMQRDFTYCDDIIDGVIRIAQRPAGYQIINLGAGKLTSLDQLIRLLGAEMGVTPVFDEQPLQLGDVSTTLADISKAQEMYGYRPGYPLERGLKSYVSWLRSSAVSAMNSSSSIAL
jgi:UDP-glucuronate 4-epimerase